MELSAVNLTKRYGSKTAVNRLNATLTNGVYGLLGTNGAGKTTFMRLLCTVQRPTSGKIDLDGKSIWKLGERYRDVLGYLPQHFGYYPDFTALDFLLYVAALKGLDDKKAKNVSNELLDEVGLSGERRRKIKTFSGGMIRRLGIAQALLNDPEILILDEPTSGLDPKERIRFRNIISALSKGRIVILSTHIVSDVEFIADQILLMKQGCIVEQGTCREVTGSVRGKVWEYLADPEEADRMNDTFAVSNLKNEGDRVYLRIVSDTCPCEGAVPAEPGLEDVYLYYFGTEK